MNQKTKNTILRDIPCCLVTDRPFSDDIVCGTSSGKGPQDPKDPMAHRNQHGLHTMAGFPALLIWVLELDDVGHLKNAESGMWRWEMTMGL